MLGSVLKQARTSLGRGRGLAALAVLLGALALLRISQPEEACVRVFYDASPDAKYSYGRSTAIFLQNLLGHFPEFRPIVAPIETYKRGQIEECRATLYLGTFYDNAIPKAFIEDYVATEKRVAWIGYSIWQLPPERLAQALGVKYLGLTKLDRAKLDARGRPTFYRLINYKGATFEKYGEFDRTKTDEFVAPFEMTALQVVSPRTETLALAVHNGDASQLPYAIRSGNRFYVADIPFSYIHEADRYLVFADLLFDILGAPPRRAKRLAVFRIEDVHAKTDAESVLTVARTARGLGITPHVALIPVFTDPFGALGPKSANWTPMKDDPAFMATIAALKSQGARFIWHGVTHQYGTVKNPAGATGHDFEFWDVNANAPVPDDSPAFVLNRLNEGWKSLQDAGIAPKIWEVPHYGASVLDYLVFARVFAWNIGRIGYQPFEARNLPVEALDSLWYERSGTEGHATRLGALGRIAVTTSGERQGQLFPYEIYRDVYGQRVLPENLGFVGYFPGQSDAGTIDTIIKNAERNLVLRDAWASFFYHPFFVKNPGAQDDLVRLLKSLQAMGYEFVDLEEFIRAQR